MPEATGESTVPDQRTLLAEIEREVRERRRSGAIDPAFEAELDGAFAAVAPGAAASGGFDAVVDQAARHAIVDYDVPIHGRRPVRFVKRTVKQLTAWYMIFVGRQLVAFAATALRALRMLGERVDRIEQRSPATDPRVAGADTGTEGDPAVAWLDLVRSVQAASPAGSLLLHADCGDGALLAALGGEVYGVDPRRAAGERADAAGIEVRCDDVLDHLRALGSASLGTVVLSGCTERRSTGDQIELARQACRVVAPGGAVVIVSTNPAAWAAADSDVVARDLAPGRPIAAATWVHLCAAEGYSSEVHDALAAVPSSVADSNDAAVQALASVVFVSPGYAVVARRMR